MSNFLELVIAQATYELYCVQMMLSSSADAYPWSGGSADPALVEYLDWHFARLPYSPRHVRAAQTSR